MRIVLFGKPCAEADETNASAMAQAASSRFMLTPFVARAAMRPRAISYGLPYRRG
jgi:hypothetical protein